MWLGSLCACLRCGGAGHPAGRSAWVALSWRPVDSIFADGVGACGDTQCGSSTHASLGYPLVPVAYIHVPPDDFARVVVCAITVSRDPDWWMMLGVEPG